MLEEEGVLNVTNYRGAINGRMRQNIDNMKHIESKT
jgi:hypothetical protein